jgi:putative nucleotidyltransferase with HDIG domain
MQIVIIALLGLLVLGVGLVLIAGRKSSRPVATAPATRAARSVREAASSSGKTPAKLKPAAPPPIDIWRFSEAPVLDHLNLSGDMDGGDMSAVMAQAEGVADHLQARQSVLAGVSGANFDPKQISELVTGDPALAAQVLRIVNSSYYGLGKKVGSVFRAVVYLGHVEVRNIVWRACVSEGLESKDKQTQALVEELWAHSFACSKVAYALARSLKLPEPDQLSTTALLHDIGKLISLNVWPERARSLYQPVQFSGLDTLIEEARLGAQHGHLGAEVAKAWGLPEESVQAIGEHHMPSYLPISSFEGGRKALAVVHIADLLVHATAPLAEGVEEPPVYLPHESWLKLLGAESIDRLCTPTVMAALPRRIAPAPLPKMAPEPALSVD